MSAPTSEPPPAAGSRPAAGSGLRVRAARGTLITGAFLIGVNALAMLRGVLVAAFLTRTEYGIWGVVLVVIATVQFLKEVGIGDRFVQQDEDDQELAFQKAMSLEILFSMAMLAIGALVVPMLAVITGEGKIVAPALVALLVIPAQALQAPLWIFYRELDFARQRKLQAIEPVVAFLLMVVLLSVGLEVWALVIGLVGGSMVGAAVSVRVCPFPLRLVVDRATSLSYASFSWPIFLAGGAVVAGAQALVIVGEAELGLAGVGVIAITAQISQYADHADHAVTQTIYPTICAVQDRAELLYEAFVTSNRLAIMWGAPFGLGLALFAEELVEFGIGERWRPAIGLLQAVGVVVAIRQIGFNWGAFYRARGETKPIAVAAGIFLLSFAVITVPLLIVDGLSGLALATLIGEAISLCVRGYYLRRIFARLDFVRHALRGLLPSAPAVATVLLVRELAGDPSSLGAALGLVALYILITGVATAFFERKLVREVLGYVRGRTAGGATA